MSNASLVRRSAALAVAEAKPPPPPTDDALLREYCATRSSEVLAVLIGRHRPMVLRTCLRLLSNAHDAEDATQAAFLVLAQRPEMVRRSLVGCLHELARAAAAE